MTSDDIDYSLPEIRREVITRLFYAGKKIQEIIVVLDRRKALEAYTFHEKIRFVKNEINSIKNRDRSSLLQLRKDADQAFAEYVGRQHFLYGLAVENRDIPNAMQLSKDIARAYGIRTDQPIEVKTDLGEMLRQASMARRPEPPKAEKVEEPRRAIALLPASLVKKEN